MDAVKAVLNSRYFIWVLLGLPFVLMVGGYRSGEIFYGEVVHASGELSARLLIVAMAATPLRLMFPTAGWPQWLLRQRRYVGVAAFVYALLHTVVYLQKTGIVAEIVEEGLRFNMWTGWLGLLIFAALALTSNDVSVRYLKRTWRKLHRLVYPAAVLAFLHWIFIAFDYVPGLIHAGVLALLEAYRVWKTTRSASA